MCGAHFQMQERRQEAIEGYMTPKEVSRTHHEDFYGALRKNDLEKLVQLYPTTTCS